jgi:hypothetical protein
MEINNKNGYWLLLGTIVVVGLILLVAISKAQAATTFSSASPFKQGGTGNTQIIPVYPNWSVDIPLSPPVNFALASSTTGGSLGSRMPLYFKVAAIGAGGTTTPTTELSTTTVMASSQVNLTWTPSPGATGYAIYYATTTPGAENAYQMATTTNAYDFTSTSTPVYANPLGFPTAFSLALSNATSSLSANGVNLTPFATSTVAIGGGALTAGACATATSTLPYGNTVSSSTVFLTTPKQYPGSGVVYQSYALSTTQIVTQVCALLSTTPVSTAYNIRAY